MATPQSAIRNAFEPVDTITDASGITARISRRTKSGEYTVAIVKVFVRDKVEEQTSYIPETLWPDYLQMVEKVTKRLEELRNEDTQKRMGSRR